jgi:hypothetical protein
VRDETARDLGHHVCERESENHEQAALVLARGACGVGSGGRLWAVVVWASFGHLIRAPPTSTKRRFHVV